jgi:hypothetical protein
VPSPIDGSRHDRHRTFSLFSVRMRIAIGRNIRMSDRYRLSPSVLVLITVVV